MNRIFSLVLPGFFLLSFSSLKAQKKIEFDFPEDMVADTAKQRFTKEFNQGHTLYNITCAKCHNKTLNKKEVIPDFSLPQLMDYEMRLYPQHAERLSDNFITDVEMQKVILFLRYKKKVGITVTPPATL